MKTYSPNLKVLFLDDEVNLLKALGRLAQRFGYQPTLCSDARDALAAMTTQRFAVIVSDYRMPHMVGTEFLAQAKEKMPNAIRILLTGYADVGAAIQAVNKSSVYRYLTKPWDETLLRQTLSDAFKQFNLTEENRLLQEKLKDTALHLRDLNRDLEGTVASRTQKILDLNRQLESAFLGSIKVMGAVAHADDPRGIDHSRRVAQLCVEVAKEMGWSGRPLHELQIAAYLHDIADSLSGPRERHAEKSYELMRLIPDLGQAYEYVKLHHAPLDENIPMGARILSLVDAYDEALFLSDRPSTPQMALLNLKDNVSKQYDEKVFEALHTCLKKTDRLKTESVEESVSLVSLAPGVVLSRDLLTRSGKVLMRRDNEITDEYLTKIFKRHREDPLPDDIYVYRASLPDHRKKEAV